MAYGRSKTSFEGALDHARREGWALLDLTLTQCLQIAVSAGHAPVPTRPGDSAIGELRAVPREQAHPASLSAKAGLGQLPLHTDGACLRRPPDFTLLEAVSAIPGEDTLLWRLDEDDDNDDTRHGVFAVIGRGSPFAAHALNGAREVRFDPGCMRPRDPAAARAAHHFGTRAELAHRHGWHTSPGSVLVINNRTTLHGRTSVGATSRREMRRLMLTSAP